MDLRSHVQNTLKLNPAASPWPKMLLCGVATTAPLFVGHYRDQLSVAIFGALAAYLLVLNDHLGPLWRRLLNFTLTFIALCIGMTAGILLEGHPQIFTLALLVMTYFIGLMDAKNSEFERAVLFATFQMLAGFATSAIGKHIDSAFSYALLGYVITMLAVILIVTIAGQKPQSYQRYRDTIRSALTRDRSRHFYSFTYCLAVLATLSVVTYFKVDHGYWAVGTVLITMRPDSLLSIYRSIQRLFGTLLGVIIAGLAIYYIRQPLPLIVLTFLVCVGAPWALASAYWLGSGFLAVVILILLDLPFAQVGDLHTPFLRLQATAIGCGFTILAVLATHLHKKWAKLIFH
ncbi:FUSC family protein [Bdellovibrio sp. HCB337]|uniref:FUSC family protein n=1 Tax=Bdellovibrio sp. HCB337 TaxID=3394358 RepID=UPI0039A65337